MGRIVQLTDAVANQIAAGEVVERPASVVKELLENAVDAGATRIEVEIAGGGTALIRVTDDGTGMSPDDALMCLRRHATSKISAIGDLDTVGTLGFRGEALPSIASVSRFTLITRPHAHTEGTKILIEGGAAAQPQAHGAAPGTSIEVRDLFFNVPARRKFLKRPATEMSHISDAVERVALAHPALAMKLVAEGRQVLDVPAASAADPRGWLARILGRATAKHMFPIAEETTRYRPVRVTGWVGAPQLSERTTRGVHSFVNGRFVKDRTILHAVQDAYRQMLSKGRQPVVVLWLEVDPATIDVNVHPQKIEVRFSKSSDVHRSVTAALGAVLQAQPWLTSLPPAAPAPELEVAFTMDASPSGGFDEHRARLAQAAKALGRERPAAGAAVWGTAKAPKHRTGSLALPFEGAARQPLPPAEGPQRLGEPPTAASPWRSAATAAAPAATASGVTPLDAATTDAGAVSTPGATYLDRAPTGAPNQRSAGDRGTPGPGARSLDDPRRSQEEIPSGAVGSANRAGEADPPPPPGRFSSLELMGQLRSGLLICEAEDGLVLIDPRAAHMRLIYDRLEAQLAAGQLEVQPLLVPLTIELDRARAQTAAAFEASLAEAGFELIEFGGSTWALKSAPAALQGADLAAVVLDILDDLADRGASNALAERRHAMLIRAAQHAAAAPGKRLGAAEVQVLLHALDAAANPSHGPDGRPTLVEIGAQHLSAMFERR